MKLKSKKYFLIGIVLLSTISIFPCGPFFENAIFHFLYNQYDKESYLRGNPIIIKPSFFKRDLTIAYRYLLGNEKIKETIYLHQGDFLKQNTDSPLATWLKTRQSALGQEKPSKEFPTWKYIQAGNYSSFDNCLDDSFIYASKKLQERVSQFGTKSKEVITWVTGQDLVFSNCSGESTNIPPNINYPPEHILVKDRKYQIAAANFYSTNFDLARKQFEEISEDKDSPYQDIAGYLIVRCLIRKASVRSSEGYDISVLKESEKISQSLLAKVKDEKKREILFSQWNLIQYYLNPMDYLKKSEKAILENSRLADIVRFDFGNLIEKYPDESRKTSDMADWILNFRTEEKQVSLSYALDKWKKTKSTHWYVSIISKISHTHSEVNSFLEEGRNFNKSSYAYLTVSYHRIRLLLEQGRIFAADTLLKEVLSHSLLDKSDRNLFLNFKPYLAKTETEFINSSYLNPIGHSYDDDSNELFDKDTSKSKIEPHFIKAFAQIWNAKIPLDKMLQIYRSSKIPKHLEENFLFAIFARAVILNRIDIITELSPVLSSYSTLKKEIELFRQANTKEEKEFIGILSLLRIPGIKPNVQFGYFRTNLKMIDDYRDNWWCAFSELKEEQNVLFPRNPIFKYTRLKFISETEDKQAQIEWDSLLKTGTAPDYLSAKIIDFSKTLPNNPHLPEALHLAVKSTRFGCTGDKTSEYSKNAFRILHKKFPNSEWANKTQYHF